MNRHPSAPRSRQLDDSKQSFLDNSPATACVTKSAEHNKCVSLFFVVGIERPKKEKEKFDLAST